MTLETKLNRVVIVLFIVAAIMYTALLVYFQQQRIELTAGKIAFFLESIAENNTKSLANELFESRYRAIKLRLESIVNTQGIDHAAVFDTHAESIVDTDKNGNNLTLQKKALPSSAVHRVENSNLIFITPIQAYDETFGFLYLQYPLKDLKKEETRNLLLFALSILLFMLITLILIKTFIRKSIVSPLNNLIIVMGDVKTGSFGRQIEVTGSDEIQKLSQTFNLMSEKISTGYVKIRKTRLFIEQIIDTIDSILISIEVDNRVTAWNAAAVHYTGLEKPEAVGEDLFTVFPHLQDFKKQITDTIHLGKDEFIYRQSIGGIFYNIFIYSLPDKDAPGALIRLDDITHLEEKENQLRQAQKMETVGQLAGGVAHDFNNMLSGVMGAAELLKLKNQNPETTTYLDIILDSGKRAADLVTKLLAFSRKNKLETQAIDVHDAITAAIALLKRSIDKNIKITTTLHATRSVIEGNLTELQHNFLNLGINASHAMPKGGELSFSTRLVDRDEISLTGSVFELAPGTYIEIDVQDTGQGIPEEYMNAIFEPFFTTKEQGKGTGLGLSAVYGTVQQLHGAVVVDSTPGSGTVFHLYFPLSDQQPVVELDSGTPLVKGRARILVVDDEELVRTTATGLLEALGYNVLTAENGRKAVEIYAREHETIDLVLLDMMMPEMNGTNCFLALRELVPQVRVILSSGFTPDAELDKLKGMGLAGFISKPYQLNELSQVLDGALHPPA